MKTMVCLLRPIVSCYSSNKQGEYQPVYDEFGACYLLIGACVARFGLKRSDLGPLAAHSFIAHTLDSSVSMTTSLKVLTEDETRHLTGWIRALFETEGISDELMSACPPQSFYRLVPTIFNQIVIARRVGALQLEKLNNGLERR